MLQAWLLAYQPLYPRTGGESVQTPINHKTEKYNKTEKYPSNFIKFEGPVRRIC